eukprot:TRINITY_DN50_c1_g1_i2.p1 TRINITY_DN50_c1_g1~~TRINITY_DN50_c1_g1_i2.p1  ORF type:complete len:234 (+),score=27.25 TRINITY_DN50_c1_g1_i2:47-703(+)
MKFITLTIVFAVFAVAAHGQAMQATPAQCADCDRFNGMMGGLAQHAFPGQGDNRQVDMQLCARLPANLQQSCESSIQMYGMQGVQTLISENPAKLCPHVASCYEQGSLPQQQFPAYGQPAMDPAAAQQTLLSVDEGEEDEGHADDHEEDEDDDDDDSEEDKGKSHIVLLCGSSVSGVVLYANLKMGEFLLLPFSSCPTYSHVHHLSYHRACSTVSCRR